MSKDDAIVSCVTLTGSEYVAMLAQAAELAKEITSLLNRLADERTENMRLRAALRWFVDEYERTNFIRTADMHEQDCRCLRCAYDNARAALDDQPAPGKEEA